MAEVQVPDSKRPVTVLGALPGVQCGETLQLSGEWTRHPQHGDQFKIAQFKSQLPASVHGIRKYLGSGLIHGIGKSYAKKSLITSEPIPLRSSVRILVASTRSPVSASNGQNQSRSHGMNKAPYAMS